MKKPKLSAHISLREALLLMGKEPTKNEIRNLRRAIQRRELLIQDKIMIQGKVGGPYRTTLAILKDRMPEFFDLSSVSQVEDALVELREDMAELRERDKILMGKIKKLRGRVEELESGAHGSP